MPAERWASLRGARVGVPAFLPDAVDGVAPVGHQPDLLAHVVQGVGQRGRRRDRQLRAVRLVLRIVGIAVEIQQHRGPGHRRRLVDLAVQQARCGPWPASGCGSSGRRSDTGARRRSAWGLRRAGGSCGPRRWAAARRCRIPPGPPSWDTPARSAARSAARQRRCSPNRSPVSSTSGPIW